MCAGPVFQHLRKIDANFLDRVRIVGGDLQKPCVGIEDASTLHRLKEEIDIVIHAAADVRFNEPLYDLILCNLYGTRELLELSKQMRRLKVFVYMSTAFSNCKAAAEENIAEEFYPPPLDADVLIDYVRTRRTDMDRELLRILSPNLIKPWPNNYTFSKALSESIVRRYGTAFPICVIRPTIGTHYFQYIHCDKTSHLIKCCPLYYLLVGIRSVSVISTYADPIPAWSNSYGGMNGVTAGIGSGLLRNLFWKNIQLNIVCADFVTNGSLAIAWHTAKEYHKSVLVPKIYHINRYPDPTLFFGTFTLALLHRCTVTRAFIWRRHSILSYYLLSFVLVVQ